MVIAEITNYRMLGYTFFGCLTFGGVGALSFGLDHCLCILEWDGNPTLIVEIHGDIHIGKPFSKIFNYLENAI